LDWYQKKTLGFSNFVLNKTKITLMEDKIISMEDIFTQLSSNKHGTSSKQNLSKSYYFPLQYVVAYLDSGPHYY